MSGGCGPVCMPVRCRAPSPTPPPYRLRRGLSTIMGNYLGKHSRSLRRHERRPSYTHTAAPVLGPRAVTPGVAANSGPSIDVSSTAHCAASTGRVPGLGGVSSSPVHRALCLGVNKGPVVAELRT